MARRKRGPNGLPWYWEARGYWVAPGDKSKRALRDADGLPVMGKENRENAMRAWHERAAEKPATVRVTAASLVTDVLDLYLTRHCEKNVSAKTFGEYLRFFKAFAERYPNLPVRELRADHLEDWWKDESWNDTTKNYCGSTFKAALNWAASRSRGAPLIPENPIRDWKLPTPKKRSAAVVVTKEDYQRVIDGIRQPRIRDILTVIWETGTRPVNLTRTTAAHVSADGYSLVFDAHNTPEGSAVHKTFKRSNQALIVPLTDTAREIVLRLTQEHPTGPIFRSPTGLPWNAVLLANTVRYYSAKAGLQGQFVAYSGRHTVATELLLQGESSVNVAAVLGNTPKVIERSYSHVAAKAGGRLRELLQRRSTGTCGANDGAGGPAERRGA